MLARTADAALQLLGREHRKTWQMGGDVEKGSLKKDGNILFKVRELMFCTLTSSTYCLAELNSIEFAMILKQL